MNYPAFSQQTKFCDHTITLDMNLDAFDWYQFACERVRFEDMRPCKDIEEIHECMRRRDMWAKFANKTLMVLTTEEE
jgi:hypothetical protein